MKPGDLFIATLKIYSYSNEFRPTHDHDDAKINIIPGDCFVILGKCVSNKLVWKTLSSLGTGWVYESDIKNRAYIVNDEMQSIKP